MSESVETQQNRGQALTLPQTAPVPQNRSRAEKPITRKQKLLLLAASFSFCFLLAILGEVICRLCLDIQIQGNTRELFVADAFGETMGYKKNSTGVSFGANVWTDGNGFRFSPGTDEKPGKPGLLILGDSVGFGCGVEEPHTFAGLLRNAMPDTTVYNSSVIGYALPDYRNVVRHFLPDHPEINKVYLSFCVNDVSNTSATQIEKFLRGASDHDPIGKFKALPVIREVHRFLRSRSKLYVGLKNLLTNSSERYFRKELPLYAVDDQTFSGLMQPALDIAQELKERGIEFTIVLAPCQPQVHSVDPEVAVPQRKVAEFCASHQIRCIDPMSSFRAFSGNSSKLYLGGDAMHFSAAGHRLYFEFLMQHVQH